MNRVTLMGRVGADPEIRSFQTGDKVANLRIATSERWKDKQTGEKKEKTEWHQVSVFGGAVGVVESYVKKGDQILIEGQLTTRKWQDQSGADRYTTEVVIRPFAGNIELIGGKREGNGDAGGYQSGGQGGAPAGRPDMDDMDEVPF